MSDSHSPFQHLIVIILNIGYRAIISTIPVNKTYYLNMKTTLFVLIVFYTLITVSGAEKVSGSDQNQSEAAKKSAKIFIDLYLTLRNAAFPNSPYSPSVTVHNRLVLMLPGKVFDYDDYNPGDLYTASMKAKNMSDPQSLVSPSVMEKWYDIADVVVGGDLNSGVTSGRSLSTIYRNVLSQMTVKDFEHSYKDAEAKYGKAMDFLTESIHNPDNLTEQTTRMKLYHDYREEYAKQRSRMENAISNAHQNKTSLEYEHWFRRNFPLLNARAENAYTKWLVFGQKEQVEMYTKYLGKSSASDALNEARITLEASGVLSMDHTRMIYPVSFEPSNWYEYLLTK